MMTSLGQTLTISQLKSNRKPLVYTKPQRHAANITTSALARSRFSLETSGGVQAEQTTDRSQRSRTPTQKYVEPQLKDRARLQSDYDSYDLRKSFSAVSNTSMPCISRSARYKPIPVSAGPGDYDIRVVNRQAGSLNNRSDRFETVEKILSKESLKLKYGIPVDRNVGPQTYQSVSTLSNQLTKRSINMKERTVKNIILDKKMETGPGHTQRFDMRTMRGGMFSESGHVLDVEE